MPIRSLARGGLAALVGLATVSLAACAQPSSPPREVQNTPPSVTYKYGNDRDLLAANQRARDYCAAYQTIPSIDSVLETEADGTKTVTFKCLKSPPAVASVPPPAAPPQPITQTYTSDMELLQAMNSADRQCAAYGQRATSNITVNTDGTKTITFRCVAG